jgi:hypothetical protein
MLEGAPFRGAPPPGLDELVDVMKSFARERLPGRDPDDDLLPLTEVAGAERSIIIGHPFSNEAEKEFMFTEAVPTLIEAANGRCYASVQHVWGVPEDAEGAGEVRPSEHPDRTEFLMVSGSDGLRFLQVMAPVLRADDQPPVLGEWLETVDVPADEVGGLVPSACLRALATARLARATRIWTLQRPPEYWTEERREAFRAFDAQVGVFARDGDMGGEALVSAFLALYLDEAGELEPEIRELAGREDLFELKIPDFTEEPWA